MSCAAEPALAAWRRFIRLDGNNFGANNGRDNQLGDAVAPLNYKRLLPPVDEQNMQDAAKIAVNRTGRVQDADAMPEPPTHCAPVPGLHSRPAE